MKYSYIELPCAFAAGVCSYSFFEVALFIRCRLHAGARSAVLAGLGVLGGKVLSGRAPPGAMEIQLQKFLSKFLAEDGLDDDEDDEGE